MPKYPYKQIDSLDFGRTFRNEQNQNLLDIETDLKDHDTRIDNIVGQTGESNTEIVDARYDSVNGVTHAVLKDRLDNTASQLAQMAYNVKKYGAKGDGVTDDKVAIQSTIDAVKEAGGGIVYFPPGTYKISSSLRIDSASINLRGSGMKSTKIVSSNTTGVDCIHIEPPTTSVIPFFVTVSDMWIQGSGSNGHGIRVAYAYNVTLRNLYLNGHGGDGIYSLHAMNSVMDTVRSDENAKGFSLNQVSPSQRSTTWTLISCYFGTNRGLGGLISGGDSNVLIKCLFENNIGGGLYITDGDTNSSLHSCYFEYNSGYSLNIDNGGSGYIYGGRFADENVNAHINLGDTRGWIIIGTWHSTNAIGGTGVNIRKTFAGGNDLVIASSLNGATPLSENAGAIKLIDNTGFIDRFKISTNDDIKINTPGKGVIFTTPDGLATKNVTVDNSSRLTIDNNSIGRYVSATPVSAIASGVAGDWSSDSAYLYICHAPNTWKRVAIATW